MNTLQLTELLGNLGEFFGSLAVMVTLIILLVQVRQSAKAVEESNRLQRAATVDRHSDSISHWRSVITSDESLAEIWHRARTGEKLNEVERLRLNFLFINFANTQRANYTRAITVGETGLARQAVIAVAREVMLSDLMREEWAMIATWTRLASPDFVDEVIRMIEEMQAGELEEYQVGPAYHKNP